MIYNLNKHGPRSDLMQGVFTSRGSPPYDGGNSPPSLFLSLTKTIPGTATVQPNNHYLTNPPGNIGRERSPSVCHNLMSLPVLHPTLELSPPLRRPDIVPGLLDVSPSKKPRALPYLTHLPAETAIQPPHGESQNIGVRGVL
ncbi:MAG TPA: hypothetical protein VK172_08435 [Lentimicrobium sp.]|nr:hypothetical protein [Lentimicrobium sp.]